MKNKPIVLCGLFAAIISVCSWIAVPFAVPFTMQTFGIFCTLILLGGKLGTTAIMVYILVGVVGLPVFAGFQGGAGVLFSPLGGYIIGFAAMGLIYMLVTKKWGEKRIVRIVGMGAGLAVCYFLGTLWYMFFTDSTDLMASLAVCVVPFILPDVLKAVLAFAVSEKISVYRIHE